MLIGYARVSTQDQDPALQLDALKGAGCKKVFTEKASGAQRDRPQLRAALDYMRAGDTLVVWMLDRLARSAPARPRNHRRRQCCAALRGRRYALDRHRPRPGALELLRELTKTD